MKHLKIYLVIFFTLSYSVSYSQGKQPLKKDTIYYLLDTAKIPIRDRIIEIIPYPVSHSFYTYLIKTSCMIYQSSPNFMSVRNDLGEIILKKDVFKIPFISISDLNALVCKETDKFPVNHQLYFIEHLPNGRYLKRKILLGALEHDSNDHVLKEQ